MVDPLLSDLFPALFDNSRWITGFQAIVKYTDTISSTDLGLLSQQKADVAA